MIKRIFWLTIGVLLAVLGFNLFRKKSIENLNRPSTQAFTDMMFEKFIELFDVVKNFVRDHWQRYSGGQMLNDRELEKIFANKNDVAPEFDSATKQPDISLN